ncbi:MAG: sodium/proline symporter [Acidiferrobacterales bacterium]|nr:sodium/proline symporter [Acidiferrobacterales bacterium]
MLVCVGLWAQRRNNDIHGFLIGDRELGPVIAAVSYAASSSSAWTLLGMSGIAFAIGISAIWFVVGSVTGMLISWTFLAPNLMRLSHQHKLVTLTDILVFRLEGRWAKAITIFASLTIVICFGFYVAAQLQGAGQTFHHAFNLNQNNSIIIGAIIVLVYTLLGGFWAVSVTDTIQGILMLIAAILLPVTALISMGGFSDFWHSYSFVASSTELDWFNSRLGLAALGFVFGTLGVSFGTFGQPHLLIRFMALRDHKALIQARLIAVAWFAIVFSGMYFLGLAGRVLIGDLDNSESVFIVLSEQLFSPIVAGIIIAALLSAIMSTADSQLLAGAAAISHDLGIGRYFKGHEILVSRIAITLLLIIACLIAVNIPASIFSRALLAWSALGAAFGPIVIFRVLRLNPSAAAVFLAMTLGFFTAVWFHFYPNTLASLISPELLPGSVFERVGSFLLGLTVLFISSLNRGKQ